MARPQRLTVQEIQLAFDEEAVRKESPPILSPEQFARLFGISVSTAYHWIALGRLEGAVTRIGKHRRIWRNRAIEMLFNKGQAKDTTSHTHSIGDNHDHPPD
jgi:excisionase family DNA binding protein